MCVSTLSGAEFKESDNLRYTIFTNDMGEQEIRILGIVKYRGIVKMPAYINGLPVTEITDRAFNYDTETLESEISSNPEIAKLSVIKK